MPRPRPIPIKFFLAVVATLAPEWSGLEVGGGAGAEVKVGVGWVGASGKGLLIELGLEAA